MGINMSYFDRTLEEERRETERKARVLLENVRRGLEASRKGEKLNALGEQMRIEEFFDN